MDSLLLNLETEFYFLTGVYLEGVSGLLFGVIFFSLILAMLRYEKKKEFIDIEVDISNEIGDERIAKINLSRSLIEMDQQEEAKRLLDEILQNTPSENEKRIIFGLLDKIDK